MNSTSDHWQMAFFGAAAILVLMKTWQGWQMGIARQVVNILALVAAYVVGYFGGGSLVPVLQPAIRAPDRVLAMISAAVVGFLVYFGVSIMGKLVFKKTSQHSAGLVRFGCGASGAAVGALYGLFLVWITILTIRLLGSVAEARIAMEKNPQFSPERSASAPGSAQPQSGGADAMALGLARMKQSLQQGAAGTVVQQVDPIPGTLYGILHKLGMVVSDARSMQRFRSYPGLKPLLANPKFAAKIAALQNDPEIMRDVMNGNYLGLLRNSHILAAANDSEIGELIRKFDFEKALDYAIDKPEKEPATARE